MTPYSTRSKAAETGRGTVIWKLPHTVALHTCRKVRVKTAWLRELQSFAFVAATVLSLPPYVRSCDISSQLDTAMEVKPST